MGLHRLCMPFVCKLWPLHEGLVMDLGKSLAMISWVGAPGLGLGITPKLGLI